MIGKCHDLTFGTRGRNVEKYQATERRTKDQCWERNTSTCNFLEDSRRLSLYSQAVQSSRTNVEVRIRRAHNEDKDSRVNNMVQDFDSDLIMECKIFSSPHSWRQQNLLVLWQQQMD